MLWAFGYNIATVAYNAKFRMDNQEHRSGSFGNAASNTFPTTYTQLVFNCIYERTIDTSREILSFYRIRYTFLGLLFRHTLLLVLFSPDRDMYQ